MNYLSLCCIAKNEAMFIGEWLVYHSLLGVEHFYIYDNDSATPLAEHPLIAWGLDNKRVTLMEVEGKARQLPAYNHCLLRYGKQNHWIGFIDIDEFICIADERTGLGQPPDLRSFLREFEPYAALALNWLHLSSSGHISRPAGLVIENYTQAIKQPSVIDLHIKSIVRPEAVLLTSTPHSFVPAPGMVAVDECRRPLPEATALAPISRRRAWINHYVYKSQQDFAAKLERGRADIESAHDTVPYEQFYRQAKEKTEQVTCAGALAPRVKELLALGRFAPLPPPMTANKSPVRDINLALCRSLTSQDPDSFDPKDFLPENMWDSPQAWLECAAAAMRAGDQRKAEAILALGARRHDGFALLWVMRAYVARHRRRLEEARAFLNMAMTLEEIPQTYEELFHLAMAMNDVEEAERVLFYLRHTHTIKITAPDYAAKLDLFEKLLRNRQSC